MSDEKTEIQKRLDEIEQQLPELRRLFESGHPERAAGHAEELAHGLTTLASVIRAAEDMSIRSLLAQYGSTHLI